MSSNLFTACLYSEICFFSVQPVSNFVYSPFLNFSWYWVFHLHQRLSHCSEGLEDTLHLTGGTCAYLYIFFPIFSDTPFTYSRHRINLYFAVICLLILHHLFILLTSPIFNLFLLVFIIPHCHFFLLNLICIWFLLRIGWMISFS